MVDNQPAVPEQVSKLIIPDQDCQHTIIGQDSLDTPESTSPTVLPYYLSPYLQPLGPEPFVVPVGVSARHIHLTTEHLEQLFGAGYKLQLYQPLSQPGQFAAIETLTIAGPKGALNKVRILGPARPESQVEISRTDAYQLGIPAVPRDSGDLNDTPGIVLIGPHGSLTLDRGVILAAAHIHMHPSDAAQAGLKDGNIVQVLAEGERGTIFNNVLIRVNENFRLEFHLDTDEANSALLDNGDLVEIVSRKLLM